MRASDTGARTPPAHPSALTPRLSDMSESVASIPPAQPPEQPDTTWRLATARSDSRRCSCSLGDHRHYPTDVDASPRKARSKRDHLV